MMRLFKRQPPIAAMKEVATAMETADTPKYSTDDNWKIEIVSPTGQHFKARGWTEDPCAVLRAALLEALTEKKDLFFVWQHAVFLRMKFADLDDATIWIGRAG